ncbi:hypothetical protein VV11_019065 [Trichodesmium erythraeum 21-75]|nr:hypothetical protein [Trichodesmium erythraeum 21-75]
MLLIFATRAFLQSKFGRFLECDRHYQQLMSSFTQFNTLQTRPSV